MPISQRLRPVHRGLLLTLPILALYLLCAVRVSYLHASINIDQSISTYMSRTIADGQGPYAGYIMGIPPLAYLPGALAMVAGRLFGLPDILAVRHMMLLMVMASIVLSYLLAWQLTRQVRVALLAASLMGWNVLIVQPASETPTKLIAMVFTLILLLACQKRRWFWAGVGLGLAIFTWPTALVLLPVPFASAWLAGREGRIRALVHVAAGALLVLALLVGYLLLEGTAGLLWKQYIVGLFAYLRFKLNPSTAAGDLYGAEGGAVSFFERLTTQLSVPDLALFALGLAGAAIYAAAAWRREGSPRQALARPESTGLFMSIVLLGAGSLFDYQTPLDLEPLLPPLTVFAAWLIDAGVGLWLQPRLASRRARAGYLAVVGVLFYLIRFGFISVPTRWTLQEQIAFSHWMEQSLGRDQTIQAFGEMPFLVLTPRQNATRMLLLQIKPLLAMESEGTTLEEYLAGLEASPPDVVYFSRFEYGVLTHTVPDLEAWLEAAYLPVASAPYDEHSFEVYVQRTAPLGLRTVAGMTYIYQYPLLWQAEQSGDLTAIQAAGGQTAAEQPDNAIPLLVTGALEEQRGRPDLAYQAYVDATESVGGHRLGYLVLGGLLARTGQLEPALSAYQEAVNSRYAAHLLHNAVQVEIYTPAELLRRPRLTALEAADSLYLLSYTLQASASDAGGVDVSLWLWDLGSEQVVQTGSVLFEWDTADGTFVSRAPEYVFATYPGIGLRWTYHLDWPEQAVPGEPLNLRATFSLPSGERSISLGTSAP